MSKISVIVPVYNVAAYLDESISSLIAQTWQDWEALFVNDGSTDASMEILERYAQRDSRIRVIDQPNAGAGAARNRGLDEATGEHVYFLDPDDRMDPDLLSENVDHFLRCDVDLVAFRSRQLFPDGVLIQDDRVSGKSYCFLGRDQVKMAIGKLHFEHRTLFTVWNKMYSRGFLERNSIRFSHYRTGEDFMFNVECLRKISKLCFNNKVYYTQRMRRPGSLTSMHFEKLENDRRPFLELWRFFTESGINPTLTTRDKINTNFSWICSAASYALSSKGGIKSFRELITINGLDKAPVRFRAYISCLAKASITTRLKLSGKFLLAQNPHLIFTLKMVKAI